MSASSGSEREQASGARHERDYIDRTIATVRNHRDADNCWPQWANIFADEIEALREREQELTNALRAEVDRQLGRHLCYTSEDSRKRFWKGVDAALAPAVEEQQ